MTVVLDTNVLAVIISRRSRYYPIWESLRQGDFEMLVTSDILLEYDEILSDYLGLEVAQNVLGGLELLPNVPSWLSITIGTSSLMIRMTTSS
ncbi:MAG: PIN domain-containing protein [Saprospiraceae bacterium]|nr:PIN domain-containing protein [Saprospiraceae bacterium]MDZ4706264.1 PIN domain-containing protein [Saprospiraceae bacterium]